MTTKRFPIYRDMINLILLYMIVISGCMVISSGMQIKMAAMEFIGFAVLLLASYLLREHAKNFGIYMAGHVVTIAFSIMVPLVITGKIRLAVGAVVLTLLDIRNFFNEEKSVPDIHPALAVIFFLAFLVTGKFELGYSAIVYYMGIAYVLLVMLRQIIASFHELSSSGQLTDDMPVADIFRNNTMFASAVMAVAAACMLFIRSDRLVRFINKMAYLFWTGLSNRLSQLFGEHPEDGTAAMMGDMSDLMKMLAEGEDDGGVFSMIMQILDALVWIFGLTMMAILLFRFIRIVVKLLLSNRQGSKKGGKSYRVKNEVRVRIREEVSDRRRVSIFKTPAEKVRAIYKKELLKYKKDGADIRRTKTPGENGNIVNAAKGYDIGDATAVYERVRYRLDEEVTGKDVAQIKEAFKMAGR
ncbi:MAG: hypothetical protein IK078_06060 [Lachnospiraceae bacterium]|nr:hypothetical protein [Lachnospiraceae bacterium]